MWRCTITASLYLVGCLQSSGLKSFAVHRYAEIIATGGNESLRVHDWEGKELHTVRTRSCLRHMAFHENELLLGVNMAQETSVSLLGHPRGK